MFHFLRPDLSGRNTHSQKNTHSTFLAVVFVIVQHEAAPALTAVAPEGVHTFMLAASVFFGALVDICPKVKKANKLPECYKSLRERTVSNLEQLLSFVQGNFSQDAER